MVQKLLFQMEWDDFPWNLSLGDARQGIYNLFSSIKWSNMWSTKPGDFSGTVDSIELLLKLF